MATVEFQKNFYILYPIAALNGSVQFYTIQIRGNYFSYLFYPIFRASVTAFQAIAYEFAAEMTYPVPEGTSGGLINWVSQVSTCRMHQVTGISVMSTHTLLFITIFRVHA